MLILAPSLRRSVPSTTTVSPTDETGQDGGVLAIARTQGHLVNGHRVVGVGEIDVVARRTGQHRRRGHEHRLVQGIDEDLDVDEFVRETAPHRHWRMLRAQGDRARAGRHLIAERVQRAGRNLLDCCRWYRR